jgi:hypothetical protein
MITYVFQSNQRVTDGTRFGHITSMVPGNGRPESEWYFVKWDEGTEDRYTRFQLEAA